MTLKEHWPDPAGAMARFEQIIGPQADTRLADEKRRADAEMAYRLANLAMPEDIRSRARSWGLEAFCEVLWNSAFQAGYREAMRDRDATPPAG
jgi:hypothetical protein